MEITKTVIKETGTDFDHTTTKINIQHGSDAILVAYKDYMSIGYMIEISRKLPGTTNVACNWMSQETLDALIEALQTIRRLGNANRG